MPASCKAIFAVASPSSRLVALAPARALGQSLLGFASLATNSIAALSVIKVGNARPVARTLRRRPPPAFQAAGRADRRDRESGCDDSYALDAVDVGEIFIEVRLS